MRAGRQFRLAFLLSHFASMQVRVVFGLVRDTSRHGSWKNLAFFVHFHPSTPANAFFFVLLYSLSTNVFPVHIVAAMQEVTPLDFAWKSSPRIREQQAKCSKLGIHSVLEDFAGRWVNGRALICRWDVGGGFGNHLNIFFHCFLFSLISGRTLFVNKENSKSLKFVRMPNYILEITDKHNISKHAVRYGSELSCLEHHQANDCLKDDIVWMNDLPVWTLRSGNDDRFRRIVLKYLERHFDLHIPFEEFMTCISSTLINPGEEIQPLILEHLRSLVSAELSVGIHVRTSDLFLPPYVELAVVLQ